ncbi:MAG: hypothetical protein WA982_00430 [Rubrobacteraceae bacterium]
MRLIFGVASGAVLIVLLNQTLLLNPGSEGANGDAIGTFVSVLWFFGWAAGSVGIGALSGWISGRLEILIALGSVALSTVALWFLPSLFWLLNSYLGEPLSLYLGGPGSLGPGAILINIPVLVFVLVGGTIVFFARRTDLR